MIKLTLDIERRPQPRPEAQREVQLDSYLEHAEHHPIGFTASPGRTDPDERHRP